MNINTSIGLGISNEMNSTTRLIQRSLERLSTGKRVNSPKDDAAGYSMAVNLTSQIRGLQQANLNINQAVGMLQTADAAISVQTEIVQRMRELAVQSGNGALSESDRSKINSEMLSLVAEFGRITNETEFNGMKLLDGNFGTKTFQIGANDSSTLDVEVGNFQASAIFEKTVGQGTFKAATSYTLGAQPDDMIFADFNGDGIDDVAGIDDSGTTLQVRINNGDGTFAPATTQAATGDPNSFTMQAGDLNGDGANDIILLDNNGGTESLEVYINNGDGTFKSRVTYSTGVTTAVGLRIGDFNNDGVNDIVVATGAAAGTFSLFLNEGDGELDTAITVTMTSGSDSDSLEIGDWNQDGDLDVLTVDAAGQYQIAFGDGSGSFTLGATADAGAGTAYRTVLGDFNNDGIQDVLISDSASSVIEVLLADGSGGWTAATDVSPSGAVNILEMVAGDFNNDGNLDFIGRTATVYQLYAGNGAGGFTLTTTGSLTSSGGLAAADLNGDGVLDFATVNSGAATNNLQVLIGNTKQQSALADLVTDDPSDAEVLIDVLDNTLDTLNEERTNIAVAMGRLQQAANYNGSMEEAYTESRSLIEDADVGLETSELVRNQILQQAQIAALSQANANAQVILGLLQI